MSTSCNQRCCERSSASGSHMETLCGESGLEAGEPMLGDPPDGLWTPSLVSASGNFTVPRRADRALTSISGAFERLRSVLARGDVAAPGTSVTTDARTDPGRMPVVLGRFFSARMVARRSFAISFWKARSSSSPEPAAPHVPLCSLRPPKRFLASSRATDSSELTHPMLLVSVNDANNKHIKLNVGTNAKFQASRIRVRTAFCNISQKRKHVVQQQLVRACPRRENEQMVWKTPVNATPHRKQFLMSNAISVQQRA